ncbi:MAG: DUF1684 domain-containing protein [Bacteroidetes bacterium]|nr:MAG: DUF1684 domain-containing protein [Bacteroidota bacterium]
MDLNNRKNSTIIVVIVGVVFTAIILFQYFSLSNPSTLVRKLERERELKDLQFKNDPEGPLTKEERAVFTGLNYFPVDESYRVPARLIKAARQDTLQLMATDGTRQAMVHVGKIEFELQGTKQQLTAYTYLEGSKAEKLFIPFTDLTSGVSTYGGGRYIDMPLSSELMIDFNTAYNPYCVYNEAYVCPIPPPENRIMLEIRAGEKMYEKPGEE